MTAQSPFPHRLRVAHLNPRGPTEFDLQPDQNQRAEIAAALGIAALPAARMTGRIKAQGGDAWALSARLTARVVQPCIVTLAPVETAIDEAGISRIYSPHAHDPTDTEVEMPDEDVEPLGAFIDVGEVMTEALSLALPLYPRASDATFEHEADDGDEGQDERKPFAGLGEMLKKNRDQG